jgi:hypothetical protein
MFGQSRSPSANQFTSAEKTGKTKDTVQWKFAWRKTPRRVTDGAEEGGEDTV